MHTCEVGSETRGILPRPGWHKQLHGSRVHALAVVQTCGSLEMQLLHAALMQLLKPAMGG